MTAMIAHKLLAGCTAALALTTAVTACSSSSGGSGSGAGRPAFRTDYGTDAAVIARHVPSCGHVDAESGGDLLSGATSGASCRIEDHHVVFYGWGTAKANSRPISSLNGPTVYATGRGWSAITVDSAALSEQRVIMHKIADALHGTVKNS